MIELQLPQHASHSAINSYIRCGKAYELGKLGVTEPPAWWFLGGSAVHKATEWLDKGEWDPDYPEMAFYEAFNDEIAAAYDIEPDQDKWRKAGYGVRAQGYDHWMQLGPRYVKQWADREDSWSEIEYDVSATLPSGIKIKAYVDRVYVSPSGVDIVDLKTGSTRPDSDQQLGIYSVLTLHKLNQDTKYTVPDFRTGHKLHSAHNYMFKDDEFYEMDVSNWTLETVDEIAQEWYNGIKSSVFLPNRGKQCGTCGVSAACYLNSGDTPETRKFDRLNPQFEG